MSSGFVSAGTTHPGSDGDGNGNGNRGGDAPTDAWAAAKAAVEVAKQPKEPEPEDERSLFAILQANKAKKQEEFEEKLKFKNQFKPLDEDDVEYLDSILTSERRVEEARREELETQLDAFRQQQSEIDRGDEPAEVVGAAAAFGTWAAGGRKRRKKDDTGKVGKTVKVRRTGVGSKVGEGRSGKVVAEVVGEKKVVVEHKKEVPKPPVAPAGGLLGLVAYGSDDDD